LTPALEGGEGSASRPGSTLPSGNTRYQLYRRLGGPQGRSGQVRKISPPPGFDPPTIQRSRIYQLKYSSCIVCITYISIIALVPAAQTIPRLISFRAVDSYCVSRNSLWLNWEVNDRHQRRLSLNHIKKQFNQHIFTKHICTIHFNITIPRTYKSARCHFQKTLFTQIPLCIHDIGQQAPALHWTSASAHENLRRFQEHHACIFTPVHATKACGETGVI